MITNDQLLAECRAVLPGVEWHDDTESSGHPNVWCLVPGARLRVFMLRSEAVYRVLFGTPGRGMENWGGWSSAREAIQAQADVDRAASSYDTAVCDALAKLLDAGRTT